MRVVHVKDVGLKLQTHAFADHKRPPQTVDPAEAVTVVRIFELSASGISLKEIAKKPNAEQVPPPRQRQGEKRPSWCPTAVRAMLRNETYMEPC